MNTLGPGIAFENPAIFETLSVEAFSLRMQVQILSCVEEVFRVFELVADVGQQLFVIMFFREIPRYMPQRKEPPIVSGNTALAIDDKKTVGRCFECSFQ